MEPIPPPETPARRIFVKSCGVFFIGMLFLLMVQGVALYLDDRLIQHGAKELCREGDLIAHGGVLWLLALIKLPLAAWAGLRKPWPASAKEVPGTLSLSVMILTWGLPWIHPDWLPTTMDWEDQFVVLMAWTLGLPIASGIAVYYTTRRWLHGPMPPKVRPYAANSAYRSSDGKPLWGYRLIFVCLGWGLCLLSLTMVIGRIVQGGVMAALGIACLCQWRDLQHGRFTPAVWYRGLVLMVVLTGATYFVAAASIANLVAVFFGFCIINWGAATARDLFLRPAANVQGGGIG